MTKYSYTKAGVIPGQLTDEIRASAITVALERIDYSDPSLDVWFKGDISGDEQTALQTLVDNHVPAPVVERQEVEIHGSVEDELGRAMVRSDSRDAHDSTYFTPRGDKWNVEALAELGTGDGTTTKFYFGGQCPDMLYPAMTQCEEGVHKEVKNVAIYFDGVAVPYEDYTVDSTDLGDYNKAAYFGRGFVTFNEAPANGVAITADYVWLDIGGGDTELVYDQTTDGASKTIELTFADPVHIKDGVIYFGNGKIDSKINVYAVCPSGSLYKDDNGTLKVAVGERVIAHYVVDQRLTGTSEMGHYFDVEARSTAMMPGYIIRAVVDAGSATELWTVFRLELNRERTHVK